MSPQKKDGKGRPPAKKGYKVDEPPPNTEELKKEFVNKLLKINDPRKFKSELSRFLFGIGSHPSISGTGIGLNPDGTECVRIYVADHKTDEIKTVLTRFVDVAKIPDVLPDTPIRLKLDNNNLIVELVRAPQALLASGTEITAPGVVIHLNVNGGANGGGCSGTTVNPYTVTEAGPCGCGQTAPPRGGPWMGPPRSGECPPAASGGTRPSQNGPQVNCNTAAFFTRLPGGVNVWRSDSVNKGTIGYFCKDSEDNTYLLSCNHVLAGNAGGTVLPAATGISRNGNSGIMSIANLSEFTPLTPMPPAETVGAGPTLNLVDAALAKIDDFPVRGRILHAVAIEGVAAEFSGMGVEKHGKASCLTKGKIDDVSCDMRVLGTDGKFYFFAEQIRVVSDDRGSFAVAGDSGSLVFKARTSPSATTSEAVGLLFAIGNRLSLPMHLDSGANRDVDYALMNPIGRVMSTLTDRLKARTGIEDLTLEFIAPGM